MSTAINTSEGSQVTKRRQEQEHPAEDCNDTDSNCYSAVDSERGLNVSVVAKGEGFLSHPSDTGPYGEKPKQYFEHVAPAR